MTVIFRGHKACECLARFLPVFERELIAEGVIKHSIDIAQLIGDAKASAETHSTGGAFDIWQHDPKTVWVARQMGAPATWNRTTGSFATNKHTHGVLAGCPHNAPARYQINAVFAGKNGLGKNGFGGPDDGPRPVPGRSWQEGIAWANRRARRRKIRAIVQDLRARRANINARLERLLKERKAL